MDVRKEGYAAVLERLGTTTGVAALISANILAHKSFTVMLNFQPQSLFEGSLIDPGHESAISCL